MRIIYLTFTACLFYFYSLAQVGVKKPSISFENFNNWPKIGTDKGLNKNGTYAYYYEENVKPGTLTLKIRSIAGSWEKSIDSAVSPTFSADGKIIYYLTPTGKLTKCILGSNHVECFSEVKDYKLITNLNAEWLVMDKFKDAIVFKNTKSNAEKIIDNVLSYSINPVGSNAILVLDDKTEKELVQFSLRNGQLKTIWKGNRDIGTIIFDKNSSKIAFETKTESVDGNHVSLWIFSDHETTSHEILSDTSNSVKNQLKILGLYSFAANGKSLIFKYELEKKSAKSKTLEAEVDVYSFTDMVPYTEQLARLDRGSKTYSGILRLSDNELVYRQQEGEDFLPLSSYYDDYAFLQRPSDRRHIHSTTYSLLSIATGIKKNIDYPINVNLSNNSGYKNARYLILEGDQISGRNLYSYELATGKVENITGQLQVQSTDLDFDIGNLRKFELAAWVANSDKVLVYDNFDIWLIDLTGTLAPSNLTKGYGVKNHIAFKIPDFNFTGTGVNIISKALNEIILYSYNYLTAETDYYALGLKGNPSKLSDGKNLYEAINTNYGSLGGFPVVQASGSNNYLVVQQTAAKSPNVFFTSNFKSFKAISSVYPEEQFNWLSTELIDFKSKDDRKLKGILYKPENFDPSKKYPVIFYFYGELSYLLNSYKTPYLSTAVIDIPYYVSNGYLVFTPDLGLAYDKGEAGERALNAIVGAADRLANFEWIDQKRMALNGHSWGGYVCNYLVTHTDRFAAALSGSGRSEAIGSYGEVDDRELGWPSFNMMSYDRLGSLFTNLDKYLKNSPKLLADKVKTPILFFHNRNDTAVPFLQGESFFYSLWNMGKPAWLLQYDNDQGHVLTKPENQADYTFRCKQFFDHYLKGEKAPLWMTKGIPAVKKGFETGYELDDSTEVIKAVSVQTN